MPKFRTKPIEVEAFEVVKEIALDDNNAQPGDYVVQDADGLMTVWPKEDFAQRFERVEPARRGRPPTKVPTVGGPVKKRRRRRKIAGQKAV